MARLFNAYVMVDWSAASTPKQGKDSIWIGVSKRDIRFRQAFEAHNPKTRREAAALLREVLADLRRRGDRALVGFDFALGYPRGTVGQLALNGEAPWRAMWTFLAKELVDKPDNTNNRFGLAAKMNRLMTDQPRPFWGAPASDAQRWLTTTKPAADPAIAVPPQTRHAEDATKGLKVEGVGKAGAKTAWQLMGAGSVGGQAITGIPTVKALADELGERAAVWPFQTGWKALTEADLAGREVLLAEVYPSLLTPRPEPGEIADRAQVRTLCEHFARLDDQGALGRLFAPQASHPPETVEVVEREEGWILGA